jgi:hypothetical protein
MMDNINGTYRSQDGTFTLTIANSSASTGTFSGTYSAKYAPHGDQTFGVNGTWQYVGVNHYEPPLGVAFIASWRPEPGAPYVILDTWTGIMDKPGQLSLTGVRGYLDAKGERQLHSLGTWAFGA